MKNRNKMVADRNLIHHTHFCVFGLCPYKDVGGNFLQIMRDRSKGYTGKIKKAIAT